MTKGIRRLAKNIETETLNVVKEVASAVTTAVSIATPVDTGRARANWVIGHGTPNRSTYDVAPYPDISSSVRDVDRAKSPDIYISNNLPYIDRLNKGWSKQAPAGYVERAITTAARIVRQSRIVK